MKLLPFKCLNAVEQHMRRTATASNLAEYLLMAPVHLSNTLTYAAPLGCLAEAGDAACDGDSVHPNNDWMHWKSDFADYGASGETNTAWTRFNVTTVRCISGCLCFISPVSFSFGKKKKKKNSIFSFYQAAVRLGWNKFKEITVEVLQFFQFTLNSKCFFFLHLFPSDSSGREKQSQKT